MKYLLAKKIEMTQRFKPDGTMVPVTVLEAGPCQVTQVKTPEKDGYSAVQLGFGKRKHPTKALTGHLKDLPPFQYLREFRVDDVKGIERGAALDVNVFAPGDRVRVMGLSKGRGFQGVVKRHHFRGAPKTHGTKDQLRMPGSIGATFPQHVPKGMRMAGRMGGTPVTVANLEVVEVVPEQHLLLVKGAVPGARRNLLLVSTV